MTPYNDQEHPDERPHQGEPMLGVVVGFILSLLALYFLYRCVTGEGL
jgi:hypothetical protein